MDFSEALLALRRGAKVFRNGWNGKGMWIALEDTNNKNKWPNSNAGMKPFIYMKAVDGEYVPWVASQSDLLANDWLIRVERTCVCS